VVFLAGSVAARQLGYRAAVNLSGKRILITGASSGIGADLARALAPEGPELVLSALRRPELEALAAELGGQARVDVVTGDLSTQAGADALAAAVGDIDVLVNNAGMDLVGRPWREGFADKGERLLQLNLLSPLRLANKLLGGMVERGSGALVFVTSVSAWAPFPGGSYYAASKAGLAMAAETFRIDLKGTGVTSMCVYAGPIQTAMLEKAQKNEATRQFFARLPTGRPDVLARKIVDALRRGDETIVYPAIYRGSRPLSGLMQWITRQMAPAARKSR
jgi:short-subunit dehydrogenase